MAGEWLTAVTVRVALGAGLVAACGVAEPGGIEDGDRPIEI
jgi:hypothetical protein